MFIKKLTLSIVVFFCIIYGFAENKPVLKIVAENFPPYEFKQNEKVVGFDIDVITEILTSLGVEFQVDFFSWERSWNLVKDGSADVILSCSVKEVRKPWVYYSSDLWVSQYVFFVKKDKMAKRFKGYLDAKNKVVGVTRGNSYGGSFWAQQLKLEYAKDLESNLKKLAADRIDLFPVDQGVGHYTVKLLGLENKIDHYGFVLFSKGYPMAFSKKSAYPGLDNLRKEFDRKLKEFKQSAKYQELVKKWLE